MSADAAKALSYAYDQIIRYQAQQRNSALEMTVIRDGSDGERKRHTLFGKNQPVKITGRNVPTPLTPVPLDDRWSVTEQWVAADLVDKFDIVRSILTDINSAYVRSIAMGMARTKDQLILSAVSGAAITGQTGTGTQALPASQSVASTNHDLDEGKGAGAVGLTYYKVNKGKQLLLAQYGQDAIGRLHCAIPAQEQSTLISSTRFGSSLFNPAAAGLFANGDTGTYLGVNFHLVADDMLQVGTTVPGDGGTDRLIYMWYEDAVALDVNQDIEVRLDQRIDMNMSWQPYAAFMMGAVRLDDKGVVLIHCDPTTLF